MKTSTFTSRIHIVAGRHIARLLLALGITVGAADSRAQSPDDTLAIDIINTSIEQLIDINITSVAKKPQTLNRSAAAVYVLTGDDIRRAGVRNLPDALRLVPGVEVASLDANRYAISIRGLNQRAAQHLLVLIDGRSIYDPLFAGVLWEAQDVVLEDIERIEVIRGPGGTLWGENAVNGVINIITKSAKDTLGGLVVGGGGTEERGFGTLRYGQKVGETGAMRLYAKYHLRDGGYVNGIDDPDEIDMYKTGFRSDWDLSETDQVTFQGDAYRGQAGVLAPAGPLNPFARSDKTQLGGGDLMFRWARRENDQEKFSFLAYYDFTDFDSPQFHEERHSWNLEFQHNLERIDRHQVSWGVQEFLTTDSIEAEEPIDLIPSGRTDNLVSFFVQDEYEAIAKTLWITVGSKVGYNEYSDVEYQPNVRVAYTPSASQTFWGSVARAVRIPSRLEADVVAGDFFFRSPGLESTDLLAYELGYRALVFDWLSLDHALFYNVYDSLLSIEGSHFGNEVEAETYGVEVAARAKVMPYWRIDSGYSFLELDTSLSAESLDDPERIRGQEGTSPAHQFFIRSSLDVLDNVDFDFGLRFVDRLPSQDVDSYLVGDVRLAWRPESNVELAAIARNLFDKRHYEFRNSTSTQVETGVFGVLTVKF